MENNLHPSQLHHYLQLHSRAKVTSWGCLVASVLLLSLGTSLRGEGRQYKPWLFCSSTAALLVGKSQRKTVKDLGELLEDIDRVSRFNFQYWFKNQTGDRVRTSLLQFPRSMLAGNQITYSTSMI